MNPESPLNLADGALIVLGPENAPQGQPAPLNGDSSASRKAALDWLMSATETVAQVYPSVDWNRREDHPEIAEEFDAALFRRFWEGSMDDEAFKKIWRKFYKACL